MITREQCRAARGLLNWTQQDLANHAGMSKTAINNFERGTNTIRGESLAAIRKAFERLEIEFIADYGVQKTRDTVRILKGHNALPRLWDDIFETMRDEGGEILIAYLDEKLSHQAHEDALERHLQRLEEHGVTERLLLCEGDDYLLQPAVYHRWLRKDVFQAGMTTFIYKDKVALQLWQDAMIIVIHSAVASRAESMRFEELWQNAMHTPA